MRALVAEPMLVCLWAALVMYIAPVGFHQSSSTTLCATSGAGLTAACLRSPPHAAPMPQQNNSSGRLPRQVLGEDNSRGSSKWASRVEGGSCATSTAACCLCIMSGAESRRHQQAKV